MADAKDLRKQPGGDLAFCSCFLRCWNWFERHSRTKKIRTRGCILVCFSLFHYSFRTYVVLSTSLYHLNAPITHCASTDVMSRLLVDRWRHQHPTIKHSLRRPPFYTLSPFTCFVLSFLSSSHAIAYPEQHNMHRREQKI